MSWVANALISSSIETHIFDLNSFPIVFLSCAVIATIFWKGLWRWWQWTFSPNYIQSVEIWLRMRLRKHPDFLPWPCRITEAYSQPNMYGINKNITMSSFKTQQHSEEESAALELCACKGSFSQMVDAVWFTSHIFFYFDLNICMMMYMDHPD